MIIEMADHEPFDSLSWQRNHSMNTEPKSPHFHVTLIGMKLSHAFEGGKVSKTDLTTFKKIKKKKKLCFDYVGKSWEIAPRR